MTKKCGKLTKSGKPCKNTQNCHIHKHQSPSRPLPPKKNGKNPSVRGTSEPRQSSDLEMELCDVGHSIDIIRIKILSRNENLPFESDDGNPSHHSDDDAGWDEMEGGAGYIDNEFGLFNEIWTELYPRDHLPDLTHLHSVDSVKRHLENTLSSRSSSAFRVFVEQGGSDNEYFFKTARVISSGKHLSKGERGKLLKVLRVHS